MIGVALAAEDAHINSKQACYSTNRPTVVRRPSSLM